MKDTLLIQSDPFVEADPELCRIIFESIFASSDWQVNEVSHVEFIGKWKQNKLIDKITSQMELHPLQWGEKKNAGDRNADRRCSECGARNT